MRQYSADVPFKYSNHLLQPGSEVMFETASLEYEKLDDQVQLQPTRVPRQINAQQQECKVKRHLCNILGSQEVCEQNSSQ